MQKKSLDTLCQKCGVTGVAEVLVYCSKCQISAEHSYCLSSFPEVDDEFLCEGCFPSLTNKFFLNDRNLGAIRRSSRIKPRSSRGVAIQNLKKQGNISSLVAKPEAEAREKTSNNVSTSKSSKPDLEDLIPESELNDNNNSASSDQDRELKKQKRRLILSNGDSSDEEGECVKSQQLPVANHGAQVEIPSHPSSLESLSDVRAQPIIYPTWRGWFDIRKDKVGNEKLGTVVGHLSNKACLKVFEGVKSLPQLLCVEVLGRFEAWPSSFQVSAPTDENIALYFFPGDESVEKAYYQMLEDIFQWDLVLKATVDDAELLIFTSHQFPEQYSKFDGKYYLWGVFRAKKFSPVLESADPHLRSTKHMTPISATSV